MGNLSVGSAGASYYEFARVGHLFAAQAIVTAPVIYSTAAGTGGPLLWNNTGVSTRSVYAAILGITCAVTTVTTVAAALGITGAGGQTSAPTATTTIDSVGSLKMGGGLPKCNVYRVGTPTNAGTFFLPLMGLSTGPLTVDNEIVGLIHLDGMIVVPPGSWCAIAASATASTTVAQLGLIWAEILQP